MTRLNALLSCSRIFTRSYKTLSNSNFSEAISSNTESLIDTREYIFTPGKTGHVDFSDSWKATNRGDIFRRLEKDKNNPFPSLRKATLEEIYKYNILTIGGLDYDDSRSLSAGIKTAELLAANNSNPDKYKFGALAVFPEVTREERYKAGDEFNKNPNFYPPYIKDRVNKFLIPKLVDLEDYTILDIPTSIALFAFSIGGRECMMMENALYDIFNNEYGLPQDLTQRLMSNIVSVSVGYAPGTEIFRPGGFNKVACFSVNDRAVLLPESFYDNVLTKESILNNPISVKTLSTDDNDTFKHVVVFGDYFTSIDNSWDNLDHTKNAYFKCIEQLSDNTQKMIGDCLSYSNFDTLGQIDEFFE